MEEELRVVIEAAANSTSQEELLKCEDILSQARSCAGFCATVLNLSVSPALSQPARRLSSILFKQVVERRWPSSSEQERNSHSIPLQLLPLQQEQKEVEKPLGDDEKDHVKKELLSVLLRVQGVERQQLLRAVRVIIQSDWPTLWPTLLPTILTLIQKEQDLSVLEGALNCYCLIIKKYEWTSGEGRLPLEYFVTETFPLLQNLMKRIQSCHTPEFYAVKKLICKAFYCSFRLRVPDHLKESQILGNWLELFLIVLVDPIPDLQLQVDPSAREAPWKAKKWCLHIFNRLFTRFADPTMAITPEEKQWASNFLNIFANVILERVLLLVQSGGCSLPPMILRGLLQYLKISALHDISWKVLSPNVPPLVNQFLFRLICCDVEDEKMLVEDPHEFVQRECSSEAEYTRPKSQALEVFRMYLKRRKNEVLPICNQLVGSAFQSEQSDLYIKEGALSLLGVLAPHLKRDPQHSSEIRPLLHQFVIPYLRHEKGFIVWRASWTLSHFLMDCDECLLDKDDLTVFLATLHHGQWPVRVQSVLSLRYLIHFPLCREIVQSSLSDFFSLLLELMKEVDHEELVATMEIVIFEFKDQINPFACGLCERLSQELVRLIDLLGKEDEEDEDEDVDLASTAVEYTRTLLTLVESVLKAPHLLPNIFSAIFPFLEVAFEEEALDFFENTLKILTYISYFSPLPLDSRLWLFIPRAFAAFESFGLDYLNDIVPFIDSMLSRDPHTFLHAAQNGAGFFDMTWKVIRFVLTGDDIEQEAIMEVYKLVESLLQNCPGQIDTHLPEIIVLLVNRLLTTSSEKFRSLSCVMLCNCFMYDASTSVSVCFAHNDVLSAVLWHTIQSAKLIRGTFDTKQMALGLNCLLVLPEMKRPPELAKMYIEILKTTIDLVGKSLEKQSSSLGPENDPGSDDDDELVTEFKSPLDQINEIVFFLNHLESIQSDPLGQAALRELPPESVEKVKMFREKVAQIGFPR